MPRWEKDKADLEELTGWTSRIIFFAGLAVAMIIVGVVVAFCAL